MALGIPKSIGLLQRRARVAQPVALLTAPGSKEHPALVSEHLPLTHFTAKSHRQSHRQTPAHRQTGTGFYA